MVLLNIKRHPVKLRKELYYFFYTTCKQFFEFLLEDKHCLLFDKAFDAHTVHFKFAIVLEEEHAYYFKADNCPVSDRCNIIYYLIHEFMRWP